MTGTIWNRVGLAALRALARGAAITASAAAQTRDRSLYRGVETSQWVNDGLDILSPALISLTSHADRLRMRALLPTANRRPTKAGVTFTCEGAWERDQASGSGRVTPGKDGRLRGVIRIKDGDSSRFVAERADEPNPHPASYRDKWRQ